MPPPHSHEIKKQFYNKENNWKNKYASKKMIGSVFFDNN